MGLAENLLPNRAGFSIPRFLRRYEMHRFRTNQGPAGILAL
jgi:hypothetical protein